MNKQTNRKTSRHSSPTTPQKSQELVAYIESILKLGNYLKSSVSLNKQSMSLCKNKKEKRKKMKTKKKNIYKITHKTRLSIKLCIIKCYY